MRYSALAVSTRTYLVCGFKVQHVAHGHHVDLAAVAGLDDGEAWGLLRCCQWRWGERGAGFRAGQQAWLGQQVAQLVYGALQVGLYFLGMCRRLRF